MKALAALAGALVLGTGAALADGGITVKLPDVSNLSDTEAKSLIAELANVNVITSNCPDYEITDGEWTLITGTGDLLAAKLGLDASAYDRSYYGPAFKLLDDPGACDRVGPTAKPLIQRLVGMGGGTTPLTQSQ
ncbi:MULTISPECIES: carbohydrate kinase family protein [Paracoccus]|jgi:hypothetical protein|uniref:Uncharacterized protein n=1 Tax=Paracoccus denitrificans (strain Pd 1222) TaxID=318586 RepID=A1AZ59_PARDP|nr:MULTISPECIES: hypothetical protein [Paracoccus]ABL68553.1 hypothetical protein Pden_0439 [Paracoccus denitrificans PD1222]MBB4625724.1 hypothetical protein [Paracoccus denitrificans]MCU7427110.1 hypothetical protein [Paracoccus denitrificans]MDK8874750.1 hypothetical protein [Paracoccus sp. SSJ]QAR26620.1 hypothetical protein EO213_10120 [Paracoccus denitrificans]